MLNIMKSTTIRDDTIILHQTPNTIISISPTLHDFLLNQSPPNNIVLNPHPHTNAKRINGTVEPIKSLDDIQLAKKYFLNQIQRYPNEYANIRNYVLFIIGINCARRIGDLVQFKVKDFINSNGSFKEHFAIKEQKTSKPIKIKINKSIRDVLTTYLSVRSLSLDDYLFLSRKGVNQPMTTRSVSKIMKEMSRSIGLEQRGININTHSLRKTWAYHTYIKNPTQIVKIQKALNHSSPNITLRYIGIDQEEMDELFDDNNL